MKRSLTNRLFLPLCLTLSLTLLGGCSYSASSTTESSVSVTSDGKPQMNASASVNVERSTDGKSLNQKTSVYLDSQSGVGTSSRKTASRSEDGLQYVVENDILRKGETEISGYFLNEGGSDVRLKDITLSFAVANGKKQIWADETDIVNANISVRPGEKKPHTFVVANPGAPAYDGPFDFDYKMNY